MPLIKDGRLAEDVWTAVADDAPMPSGPAIVSLARWEAQRASLTDRNAPLGLLLPNDRPVDGIAADLAHFALIALTFPKFADGRAYSQARQLRERYGYDGELRAVGNVLRDQFLFMHRCGFDAFEVPADLTPAWQAALVEIGVRYQPAADSKPSAVQLRGQGIAKPCAGEWAF
ncbi:MAG: DUF934 domain-containing protein [Alphaproteobacteria bacterium]